MKDEVKNLGNTSIADVKKTTSDVEVFGNGDAWLLICKASSKSQGWMKSTKAMEIEGQGCLVQVTTEHRSSGLTQVTACSDSITYVHGVRIDTIIDDNNKVVERKLVSMYPINIPEIEVKTKPKVELDTKVFEKAVDSFIGGKDETVKNIDNEVKKKG